MKYNGPKVRLSRQLGIPLTPKAARILEKKAYPPGQHGPGKRQNAKMSDYKRQLLEKQRLRAQYNISEKQLLNYYKKAARKVGNTSDNLIQMLESRLDAVVLRGGLARTIYASRQFVGHGHVMVNGKPVNIPSYQVKPGDVVSIREKSRKVPAFSEALKSANPPEYLETSKPDLTVTYSELPRRVDVPVVCEMSLVIEYYSR